MKQLSIFDNIAESKIQDLIEALNDGRKGKEVYILVYALELQDYPFRMLRVKNNEGYMYNIVDFFGNIPKDFCSNFRILSLCLKDLVEYIKKRF